ncbi:MAG: VWA domain-containing protein [Deltaproteobacteria bacterium]|nr:VWA domain-containing protein [Deltaproteobacteria bacterium]
MPEIDFLNAELLWGLALLAPFAVALYFWEQMRIGRIKRITQESRSSRFSTPRVVLPTILAALMIIAAARPYSGFTETEVERPGRDIMVVLDGSRSMMANDLSPSRLEFSKRKLLDLLQLLRKRGSGDRVGLILFAGESYLFTPLTADYAVLRHFINAVTTELISAHGSSMFTAVETAISSLHAAKTKHPTILLISDGEDNFLERGQLISLLKSSSLPLNILGIGTAHGANITLRDGSYLRDSRGEIVLSKLNEELLRYLAEESGGAYRQATHSDEDIVQLLDEFGSLSVVDTASELQRVRIYYELGPYIVWIVCAVFLATFAIGRREWILAVLLLFAPGMPGTAAAKSEENAEITSGGFWTSRSGLNEGYHAYQQGDYENARIIFEEHVARHPNDLKALQALGSAYYKLGRYPDAQRVFSQLDARAATGRDKFAALYNLGNANLLAEDYKRAIKSYTESLKIKPGDENAEYNLELAKRLLREEEKRKQEEERQQKQREQQEQQQNGDESNEQKNNQQGESPQNSENQESSSPQESSSDPQSSPQDGEPSQREQSEGDAQSQPNQDSAEQPSDPNETEAPDEKSADEGERPEFTTEDGDSRAEDQAAQSEKSDRSSPMSEEALARAEAESWLDSLPDSPILYRRKLPARTKRSEQTW